MDTLESNFRFIEYDICHNYYPLPDMIRNVRKISSPVGQSDKSDRSDLSDLSDLSDCPTGELIFSSFPKLLL